MQYVPRFKFTFPLHLVLPKTTLPQHLLWLANTNPPSLWSLKCSEVLLLHSHLLINSLIFDYFLQNIALSQGTYQIQQV